MPYHKPAMLPPLRPPGVPRSSHAYTAKATTARITVTANHRRCVESINKSAIPDHAWEETLCEVNNPDYITNVGIGVALVDAGGSGSASNSARGGGTTYSCTMASG